MKRRNSIILLTGLMIAFAIPSVLSQSKPEHYVGSTPCDPYIKSILKIGQQTPCEFIKWKVDMNTSGKTFTAEVLYGLSLPNTNGFENDGTKLIINGKLEVSDNTSSYVLTSPSLAAPLTLRAIDISVLHMFGPDRKLLVGNGGFSYSLNRQ